LEAGCPGHGKAQSSRTGASRAGSDPLADPAPARARIRDWRAFLDADLEPDALAALQAAERSGRLF